MTCRHHSLRLHIKNNQCAGKIKHSHVNHSFYIESHRTQPADSIPLVSLSSAVKCTHGFLHEGAID